jgi:predicted RNase H-like HicB family nuclease
MKFKVVIHNAEEGGYWAEVPAIPGCVTEGDTWEELLKNIYEAIEANLDIPEEEIKIEKGGHLMEIVV